MAKVENFSPFLLSLAKRAMVERVVVKTKDRQTAKRLQARFNKLRVAMRTENHPSLPLIERVAARVSPLDDPETYAVFEPQDFDLEQLLKASGIELID